MDWRAVIRWTVALAILAAGAFVAGGRLYASRLDADAYGAVDLSNRLGASRTIDDGLDPYTYRRFPGPTPAGRLVKRWNEHPYSPVLIWAYVPLGRLPYASGHVVDFWAEWAALAAAVAAVSLAFGGAERAAWIGLGLALVSTQYSWRLHVERGQAYVFLTLLLGGGMALLGRTGTRTMPPPVERQTGRRTTESGTTEFETTDVETIGFEKTDAAARAADRPPAARVGLRPPLPDRLATLVGGIGVGLAAVTRPSLGVALVLLPLCGRWRAAVVAAVTAATIFGLTLLAGDGGHWGGYVNVVSRLEQEYLFPGSIDRAGDVVTGIGDPTLADAYALPNAQRRLKSYAGNLVANELLWPWTQQRYGTPTRERYAAWSKAAAAAWAVLAAAVVAGLWWRGATPLERLTVASAAAVGIDFFLPVRYEYADVLYLVPLALALAALRRRGRWVLPAVLAAATAVSLADWPAQAAAAWRAATMVAAPVSVLIAVVALSDRPRKRET